MRRENEQVEKQVKNSILMGKRKGKKLGNRITMDHASAEEGEQINTNWLCKEKMRRQKTCSELNICQGKGKGRREKKIANRIRMKRMKAKEGEIYN